MFDAYTDDLLPLLHWCSTISLICSLHDNKPSDHTEIWTRCRDEYLSVWGHWDVKSEVCVPCFSWLVTCVMCCVILTHVISQLLPASRPTANWLSLSWWGGKNWASQHCQDSQHWSGSCRYYHHHHWKYYPPHHNISSPPQNYNISTSILLNLFLVTHSSW